MLHGPSSILYHCHLHSILLHIPQKFLLESRHRTYQNLTDWPHTIKQRIYVTKRTNSSSILILQHLEYQQLSIGSLYSSYPLQFSCGYVTRPCNERVLVSLETIASSSRGIPASNWRWISFAYHSLNFFLVKAFAYLLTVKSNSTLSCSPER